MKRLKRKAEDNKYQSMINALKKMEYDLSAGGLDVNNIYQDNLADDQNVTQLYNKFENEKNQLLQTIKQIINGLK